MKLIGKNTLVDFSKTHADIRSALASWIAEVEEAKWKTMQEIKQRYVHASIISGNRVVFNIKGNKYRVEAKISFDFDIVRITRVGTHAEYNKWQ